ncbi:MAG: glycerol-3-phosphate dehydrogenase [Hyphomicrobiaceae bacterium]
MTVEEFDLFVVGGGINGCGIAADAAGRGLAVMLAEQSDLASGTSSASSKLIHGGLRYLELYEFRLVREALAEREVLLAKAPHIVWPLRFVMPHVASLRPRWMIRAGLFLYDHLARRQRIPGSSSVDLRADPAGRPLRADLGHGFAYWDCWVDDARLVVLNARAAVDRGAQIATRTKVVSARAADGTWEIQLSTEKGVRSVRARALVNAAGPWVGAVAHAITRGNSGQRPHVRLVKGSHIVVPRIPGAEDAYLLQNADGRVVFLLPLGHRYTIVGTTDVPFDGDPAKVAIDAAEETYLLAAANGFLAKPLEASAIVWRYAGVRPLYDDASDNPSAVTRDYRLELEAGGGLPPLLTVLGGKVTTYRRLAEEAMDRLTPHLPGAGPAWTERASLPGGDIAHGDFAAFAADLARRHPRFDAAWLAQLGRRHGSLTDTVLGDARGPADLGADLGAGLTEREVAYMRDHEWARTADDVLWRRTKAGLDLDPSQRAVAEAAISRILGR